MRHLQFNSYTLLFEEYKMFWGDESIFVRRVYVHLITKQYDTEF